MNLINCYLKFIFIIFMVSVPGTDILCGQQMNVENSKKKTGQHGYSIFDNTLADLSWTEIKKAAEENALVLVPIGVIEEHGPQMCTGVDAYLACQRSVALKQRLDSLHIKTVIAPPVYWGVMQLSETGAFPGSFIVSPSTMKALLADIFANLQRWGFHYVYCINHHGDRMHRKSLNEAMGEAKEKLGIVFYNDQEPEDRNQAPEDKQYITGKLFEPDYHAGISETSAMLEYYPEFVNANTAKTLKPEGTFQPLGYVGDPANYKNINMRAFDSLEVSYYANCIEKWLNVQKLK
jgi:creatinine amidohydrolase